MKVRLLGAPREESDVHRNQSDKETLFCLHNSSDLPLLIIFIIVFHPLSVSLSVSVCLPMHHSVSVSGTHVTERVLACIFFVSVFCFVHPSSSLFLLLSESLFL